MAEDAKTRELIEAVVAEVFDQHVRALHDDVIGRVLSAVDAIEANRPERPVSQWLKGAIDLIESSGQQTDILKALLDGTANFCERAAVLVLRGAMAVMWQGRGFADLESLKTVNVDLNAGPCSVATRERVSVTAHSSQIHTKFSSDGNRPCVVIPLFVRDKVAALLYCDTTLGPEALDALALELLAAAAGRWIELQAFRKNAGVPVPPAKMVAAAPSTTSAVSKVDMHAKTGVVAPSSDTAPEPAHVAPVQKMTTPMQQKPSNVPDESGNLLPPEEQEVHRKARRFAKLLVDEIILYNREKVNEGRRNHDIYDRLKDDIDKSRATYDKRYGESPAAKFDYFRQAVVGGLAEHNMALLGSNFPR